MRHEMSGPKAPNSNVQPLRFNGEIMRNWLGFLEKRYRKDVGALQRFASIKSPAEFSALFVAFWEDAAQDYFSEVSELQKALWANAMATSLR